MPLGTNVGLGPGDIVSAVDLLHPKAQTNFLPVSVVAKRLDGSRCHLVRRYSFGQATLCYMGTQLPQKGHNP